MATAYFQIRVDSVPSTQDVARREIAELPVLVLAPRQTAGRGRSGAEWLTADRAFAVSLAFRVSGEPARPYSLMAGIAATRAFEGTTLKWPNDVMVDDRKVGGILVERSGDLVVVGFGLNLWWSEPSPGAGAIFDDDPGEEAPFRLGALWGAELVELIDGEGWPSDAYREVCVTLGQEITWDPDGSGTAVDIADDGALIVETDAGRESLYSGSVRHVRVG